MKIVDFPERNLVIAERQLEYNPLPVYKHNSAVLEEQQRGMVVACYSLTLKERIKMLFTGRVWLSIWTFGGPVQPIYMTVQQEEIIPKERTAETKRTGLHGIPSRQYKEYVRSKMLVDELTRYKEIESNLITNQSAMRKLTTQELFDEEVKKRYREQFGPMLGDYDNISNPDYASN